jgi:hypothetical protein
VPLTVNIIRSGQDIAQQRQHCGRVVHGFEIHALLGWRGL